MNAFRYLCIFLSFFIFYVLTILLFFTLQCKSTSQDLPKIQESIIYICDTLEYCVYKKAISPQGDKWTIYLHNPCLYDSTLKNTLLILNDKIINSNPGIRTIEYFDNLTCCPETRLFHDQMDYEKYSNSLVALYHYKRAFYKYKIENKFLQRATGYRDILFFNDQEKRMIQTSEPLFTHYLDSIRREHKVEFIPLKTEEVRWNPKYR